MLIVTTSGSVYHIKERKKRVVCRRRDMDRPYQRIWITEDDHLRIQFSDEEWMQTREIVFKLWFFGLI